MALRKKSTTLNIETLILVAVWEKQFIFQGCFKLTDLQQDQNKALYYFRCESNHQEQMDILNYDFSPYDYEFTHLYNEIGPIPLDVIQQNQEYAIYMLQYALHITLREMLLSRQQHFTSIDDVAMRAMIERIKPILNRQTSSPADEEHLGFAVAMDFCPKEKEARSAVSALLTQLH